MNIEELELQIKGIIQSCNLTELQRRTGVTKSHLSKFAHSQTSLGFLKVLKALDAAGYDFNISKRNEAPLDERVFTSKIHTYETFTYYWDYSLKFWVVTEQGKEGPEYYENKARLFEDYPEFETKQHVSSPSE